MDREIEEMGESDPSGNQLISPATATCTFHFILMLKCELRQNNAITEE